MLQSSVQKESFTEKALTYMIIAMQWNNVNYLGVHEHLKSYSLCEMTIFPLKAVHEHIMF